MTSKSNKSKKGSKSGGKSTSKSQEKKESESKKKEEEEAANAAPETSRTGREEMLPEGPSEPQIKEKGWFSKTNIQSFIHSYIQEKLKV